MTRQIRLTKLLPSMLLSMLTTTMALASDPVQIADLRSAPDLAPRTKVAASQYTVIDTIAYFYASNGTSQRKGNWHA